MNEKLDMNEENEIAASNDDNTPDEYVINFTLSYSRFLKNKGRTEIYDNEIKEIIGGMVANFENKASIDEVRGFFEMPAGHDADLIGRNYTVSAEVIGKNDVNQILFTKFTLKFGSKIATMTHLGLDEPLK